MKYLIILSVIIISSCAVKVDVVEGSSYQAIVGMSLESALKHLPKYTADKDLGNNTNNCFYLTSAEQQTGVDIMVVDEVVARIDIVEQSLVVTEKGVGIGSHKRDIVKAYPQLIAQSHPYLGQAGEYLEIKLPSGNGMIFETAFDTVTDYRFGRYPEVLLIEGCL